MNTNLMQLQSSDATLAVTIEGNRDPSVLFLNGGFGTIRDWLPTLRELRDSQQRLVRFDARGRGESSRSRDYSLRAAVEDVTAVVSATELVRPVLVGWSHGATVATLYAAAHPDEVSGLVLIDGAFPVSVFDEQMTKRARTQFRLLSPLLRAAALIGRGSKLKASEAAEVVIEVDHANGSLGAAYEKITAPIEMIVGTGPHQGASSDDMTKLRRTAHDLARSHPDLSVSISQQNHMKILNSDPEAIAAAILRAPTAAHPDS